MQHSAASCMLVQELPVHPPQPVPVITGVPFTASTEYDNQYTPKSLAFNQIGSHGGHGMMGRSNGQIHKLPTVSSETTNQHFYPYWGVAPPKKRGYAVRAITAAPPVNFAGDTFTTTNTVEYQPKPSSYIRPSGRCYLPSMHHACIFDIRTLMEGHCCMVVCQAGGTVSYAGCQEDWLDRHKQ